MARALAMICALLSLMPANAGRGIGHAAREVGGHDHFHHAHTHFHDGHEHTHWHSHAAHDFHGKDDHSSNRGSESTQEGDGDHHDEFNDHDDEDAPYSPPAAWLVPVRDSHGKHLVAARLIADRLQIEAPPPRPPKPPPWSWSDTHDLPQLRTVILLT